MPDRLGNKVRLEHIIDAIDHIESYVDAICVDDFIQDSMRLHAVLHQFTVVGEACNRLSKDIWESYPKVSWIDIVGLRNLVVHEYFGVDAKTVWTIANEDIPLLKLEIQKILATLD